DVSAPLMFRRELEAERGAVNREKLTLAAGVVRREQPLPEPQVRAPDEPEVPAPVPETWDSFEFVPEEPEVRHRALTSFALAVVVLAAAAGAAYWWIGSDAIAQLDAWL